MGNSIDTHAQGGGAVITGSASGMGKGMARRCLKMGMHVLLVDLRQANLDAAKAELAAELGPGGADRIGTCVADVSSQQDNQRMLAEALKFLNGKEINFLALNAGTGLGRAGHDSCYKADFEKDFKRVIEIDLFSIFHGFAAFVPVMSKNRNPSAVLTTASGAGLLNNSGQSSYTVAKHGVVLLTESLGASLQQQFPAPAGGGAALCTGPFPASAAGIFLLPAFPRLYPGIPLI